MRAKTYHKTPPPPQKNPPPIFRNEKSAQRPKFSAGRPCGHPAKNFGQALQILEKQAFWHGHAARTSTKKLRSEKLRADFSFPTYVHALEETGTHQPLSEASKTVFGGCGLYLGQKSCSPKVPRIFQNFRPEFCPEFCSEFFLNFSRIFRASFRGKRRPEKNSPKIPAIFQCKIPRQIPKQFSQKFSGEEAK